MYGERLPEIQCRRRPLPRRVTARIAVPYGKLRRMSEDMLYLVLIAALLAGAATVLVAWHPLAAAAA